jgi:hypothetical protein
MSDKNKKDLIIKGIENLSNPEKLRINKFFKKHQFNLTNLKERDGEEYLITFYIHGEKGMTRTIYQYFFIFDYENNSMNYTRHEKIKQRKDAGHGYY